MEKSIVCKDLLGKGVGEMPRIGVCLFWVYDFMLGLLFICNEVLSIRIGDIVG